MHRNAGPAIAALAAATCLVVACAADPGDQTKNAINGGGSSSSGGFPSSSSSSSGVTGSSSSSGGFPPSSSSSSSGGFPPSSSSGSSSGVGSSSGTGSSSGSTPGPTCITTPAATAPAVGYYTVDTMDGGGDFTSTQQIGFNFQLAGGLATVALSDITVRYWFTADSDAISTLFFVSYYSQINNNNITTDITQTFAPAPAANVTPTSDSYLELGFTAAAGSLAFGATAQIQAVVHGPGSNGYSDRFNESNDYSFDRTKVQGAGYAAWSHLTVYVKGVLVSGCEPTGTGGAGSSSSSSSSGGGTDAEAGGGGDATVGGADAATE